MLYSNLYVKFTFICLIYIYFLNLYILGWHSWWNSQLSTKLGLTASLFIAFGTNKVTSFEKKTCTWDKDCRLEIY